MTLEEIRQKVVEFSGRVDLASSDYLTDTGVDFFISAGSRFLDLNVETLREAAYEDFDLAAGECSFDIINARVLRAVGLLNSESEWSELAYIPDLALRSQYPGWGAETAGTPEYWTRETARHPEKGGSYHNVTTIVVMAPTSEAVTVRVYGIFHAKELKVIGDTNYWSEMYPEALALAACMCIEMQHRNTQGVADYKNALMLLMNGVENDTADSATAEGTEMEG